MQNNKELVIFTYDYPFGKSEKTFIEYEISKLPNEFNNIEIINQKNFQDESIIDKKINRIKLDQEFSKSINLTNIIKVFFTKVLFEKIIWEEIIKIWNKKKFFLKLKMSINEKILSTILYEYLIKKKSKNNSIIFYSFWSNYTLLTFSMLKKVFPKSKFIARSLGSDINGYIKNDNYVPFKNYKFKDLDKLILLGDYQKEVFNDLPIRLSNFEICPIGVFKQPNLSSKIDNDKIIFLSCGNFIDIKNNHLMINFINKICNLSKKKIEFILIGNGKLEQSIISELEKYRNLFSFKHYRHVDNLVKFIEKNKVHFFLNFSSQEGMPFSVMESMSCGIPTIASNIKPNEYLVKNNGYLFDLENYENSITKTIEELKLDLSNNKNYINKSINSQKFINKYLINENCFEKFIDVIKNI